MLRRVRGAAHDHVGAQLAKQSTPGPNRAGIPTDLRVGKVHDRAIQLAEHPRASVERRDLEVASSHPLAAEQPPGQRVHVEEGSADDALTRELDRKIRWLLGALRG